MFSTTSNYKLDFEFITHKIENQENEKAAMPSDKNIDDLKYFPRCKETTRRGNAGRFKKYCLWIEKTPEQLINEYEQVKILNNLDEWERDTANQIIEFYQWLRKQTNPKNGKTYSSNYCNTVGSAVLAFYHQNCKTIEGVMDSFAPTQMPTNEYRFSQADLRKMFHYGDTEEKALISLAVCYGQGSKDFLKIEAQKLKEVIVDAKQKDLDFAKWVGKPREKTGIQPISFLTPEATESVNEYLNLLEKKIGELPKYIWCNSKPNKPISNEGLNKKLRRLVTKANIKTGNKRVRFHCVRKFTFSRLRRIDRDIAKVICAKSVSASDMTYEEIEEQAEKVFKSAYPNLALNGNWQDKGKDEQEERIKKLEEAILNFSKELQNSRTVTEVLTKKTVELEKRLSESNQSVELFLEVIETMQPFIDYVKVKENPKQILDVMMKLVEEVGKD